MRNFTEREVVLSCLYHKESCCWREDATIGQFVIWEPGKFGIALAEGLCGWEIEIALAEDWEK